MGRMPRITHEYHYRRRSLLVLLWNDAPQIFGLLSNLHQRELHEFYLPWRDVDFEEFELHLEGLAIAAPSLVNRVGKHFKRIERVYLTVRAQGFSFDDPVSFDQALGVFLAEAGESVVSGPPLRAGRPGIRVVGIARPEVNVRLLSRALLALAKAQLEEQPGTDVSSDVSSSRRDAA